MPNGWVHATIDFIAFGRSYFELNQKKDKAYETLGSKHRVVNHEWYQEFGKSWTFSEPSPSWLQESIQALRDSVGADIAEEQMLSIARENLDRVQDSLSFTERRYWVSFLKTKGGDAS